MRNFALCSNSVTNIKYVTQIFIYVNKYFLTIAYYYLYIRVTLNPREEIYA